MSGGITKGRRKRTKHRPRLMVSLTYFMFFTTQVCALVWVSISYGIAIYSTVKLEQPFPVVEISQQAIITLLGVGLLKILENIFEHNDGGIFGNSRCKEGSSPEGEG